ncbi:serine-type endopeptidase protein [Trichomonas vaginalis G3]|uniref:serine-type endopeptidase protein n=1 Tax=Trichomonas vaginalis (strain ATCC PRA-98 / G3) TaxID=412133 RepID=UPI0021E5AE97|nr:serine-type endopeptidase protein [Trichomonas vaginalis G3]KAI5502425.1 serine-type endopeptidase protein [Trichomonas vaginalis G3]
MFYLFVAWWLKNSGNDEYGGLDGEDINWSGHAYYDKYTGKGITIAVMSDGALFDHVAYKDRAIKDQFINIYTNEIMLTTNSSHNIATASLALAAGKRGTEFEGVAPGANVASYFFTNYSMQAEHLQTVMCHQSLKWNISILQYLYIEKPNGYVQYVQPEVIPKEIADDCLYHPQEGNWPHPIVVPAGTFCASDPIMSPPSGWPLVFTISGVTNRGLSLYRSAEGASVFMVAPAAGNAPIFTASPKSTNSTNKNFTSTNASAAIFAGGLAVLLEANPNLTLSDLFYITAFSADKVNPNTIIWDKNGIQLNYNRRSGFGRLNLGRAVDIALNWTSTGKFYEYKVEKTLNLIIEDREHNVTFDFTERSAKSVLCVSLFFKSKKLSFGSLNPHIISPNGTRCEMKILTEANLTSTINSVELMGYKFLGENPIGKWTVSFRVADNAYHGTIESLGLKFFYNKIAPDISLINQRIGCHSPFEANVSKITFKEDKIYLFAATAAGVRVNVSEDVKDAYYTVWLASPDGNDRILINASFNEKFNLLKIEYTPSVFRDKLDMILIIDSMDPKCIFSSNVSVDYSNTLDVGLSNPPNGTVYKTADTDIYIEYVLHLDRIIYDGFSTSIAATIISPDSKAILNREWIRNTGNRWLINMIPSTKKFYLQISPTSTERQEYIHPMTINLFVVEQDGKYRPDALTPVQITEIVLGIVLFVLLLCFGIYRSIVLFCTKKSSIHFE